MAVVYPVAGHFLRNIPSAPLEVDAKTAERLVRTGAYSRTAPRGDKVEPIPYEADEGLDFYDNPRGDDHDKVVHGRASAEAVPIVPEESEEK